MYIAIVLISFLSLVILFQKKRITFDLTNNNYIEIQIPKVTIMSIVSNYTCTLMRGAVTGYSNEIGSLLLNAFDRPVLFVLNDSKTLLFCLYDFDTRVELLVFEIDSDRKQAIPKEIATIVKTSKWDVRRARKVEIDQVRSAVIKANSEALKEYSFPAFDIGFYKLYLDKAQLLELITRINYPAT